MTPAFLGQELHSPLINIKLANHVPKVKETREGDRGHEFADWMLLAELGFQLWVEPEYKDDFYEQVNLLRTIEPAEEEWKSAHGHALMPVGDFISCLQLAGVETIRYKAYGQKLSLDRLPREPAQHRHRLAGLNEWDIGISFPSSNIFLFKPTLGMSKEMLVYSLMGPAGRDHGSVCTNIKHNESDYRVKIYPLIAHAIKTKNSRMQGESIKTVAGLWKRYHAAIEMVQHLHQTDAQALGGFRTWESRLSPCNMASIVSVRQDLHLSPINNVFMIS